MRLHAAYAGLAHAAGPGSAPTLLWGSATAHLCLGQNQGEFRRFTPPAGVPVLRRPLGGGAVWVDEHQQVYVFIVPLRGAPRRPAEWSAWALRPAMTTFRTFGLDVEQHGEDLWLGGRKIAGTGSATIGNCAVFASSFLLRFPRRRFAACIAGSADYRAWLDAGLAATMTDWAEHAALPDAEALRTAFCRATESAFGWCLRPAAPVATESAAIDDACAELEDELYDGGPDAGGAGIKLNAESSLIEREHGGRLVRELVLRGVVARRAVISREERAWP